MGIANILFVVVLAAGSWWFGRNVGRVRRNINLGREEDRSDRAGERWATMARVALGQGKMGTRPMAAFLHLLIYVGFVIINIEVLEIIVDGIFGTHRVLSFLGPLYDVLIGSFEWLAVGVLVACVGFLARRNILKLKRFWMREMTSWPRTDANLILITEILLMSAFLTMNATDLLLQQRGVEHYVPAGAFPVSGMLAPMFSGLSDGGLVMVERIAWWFHIIGILAFLNYLPYSKHFHILLAFPNTYFSNLKPKTELKNMERVMGEVKSMMDPSVPPPAPHPPRVVSGAEMPERFGAKDVPDLTWKQLLDAYTCTECGRCTSECPANQTGKLLSPRKIMMDTRDRMEEMGRAIDAKGRWEDDGKALLGSYITEEELWACTTCNACAEVCPVNIDPVGIIMDLRRYLVMEESKVPPALASMLTNVENNGAPWQMSQSDRMKWAE